MRKLLLSSTAIVAAGLLAGNVALADDEMMEPAGPVTVGLSGYTMTALGFASGSDDARGHQIDYVYEFVISGSSTLDNGITVAVHAQLGQSAGSWLTGNGDKKPEAVFDEQHITLSGTFGSLRAGRTESAAYNATVGAPGGGIIFGFGVNYPWFSVAAPTVNTYSGIGAEDAIKLVYTSPNFNGLTVGLSYAPEDSEQAPYAGRVIGNGLGGHSAIGLNYSIDFMESGSVSLGAAYETANDETGGDDPSAMKLGINVGFDQLSFGGGIYDHDADGAQFDFGASWTEGATNVGVQWGRNDGTDADIAALHLNYTLGPGVTLGAQLAAGSSATADDVTQFMLGTAVFF